MSGAGERFAAGQHGVRGFTLFEVLVVLAILSLLAGIAFPAVEKAARRQSFLEAAARFELGLHMARAEAIRTGTPVRFALSADRRAFGYRGLVDRLPEGVLGDGPNDTMEFFPDGTASGGTISVVGAKVQRQWRVQPTTGSIELMQ